MSFAIRIRLSPFLPALALMAFSLLWVGGMTVWPRDGSPVAVVFPPGASGEAAFAGTVGAGAKVILSIGRWQTIIVARSDDPKFITQLYRSGALLVVRAPEQGECTR